MKPEAPALTFTAWAKRFTSSRIDVDESTTRTYAAALRKAGERFGSRDPATITAPEVAEWVAELAEDHKQGTVKLYVAALRLLLDFAGLAEANPARDPRVKLPKMAREEPQPPSAEHLEAILSAVDERRLLPLVVIEQGGMRVGEAVSLRWGDVDAAGLRLRLRRSATKRDKARWVQLPEWLMGARRPVRDGQQRPLICCPGGVSVVSRRRKSGENPHKWWKRGYTAVNPACRPLAARYGRSMRTNDDIWIPEQDAWGIDRLAWEDDQEDAPRDAEDPPDSAPEDPRS